MQLRMCRPGPPLSAFVEVLWSFEGHSPAHRFERLLPDGSVELVINLSEDCARIYDRQDQSLVRTLSGSIVAGPQSQYCVIDTASQSSTVGVHFKPGGAFPFLGLPASELHDQHVSLDALWGNSARTLRERLLEAETVDARLRVLEQALLARRTWVGGLHPAVQFALEEFQAGPHMRTIAEVTRQIGLSPRRFIEVFREQAGMTPKLFCRVRRFQQVVQSIAAGRQVEWTEVALAGGYFDQAHFIHDFRAFSGLSPTGYARLALRHPNHVPIL
jgi:methylphosphotriester-DNA--protein-cysteine methyltransferase